MGFQYQVINNIPTITQTGTDNSFSGMQGLTGVTENDGQYTLNNVRLVVNGTLDIDRVTDRIRFINWADYSGLSSALSINGTFDNSNTTRTVNSYTFNDPLPCIEFSYERSDGSQTGSIGHFIESTTGSVVTIEGVVISA